MFSSVSLADVFTMYVYQCIIKAFVVGDFLCLLVFVGVYTVGSYQCIAVQLS